MIVTTSSPSPTEISCDYKISRLEVEIRWHSKKARHNKSRFGVYEMLTNFSSAIIPIINLLGFADLQTRIVSFVLGATVAIVTGLTHLEKYQENWIMYRITSEVLKRSFIMKMRWENIPILMNHRGRSCV